jgi:transposase-like protein
MLTPIATVEERLRIINECRQSGLTANEWCRRHGVRWNTYHTWVTRLKKKGLLETAATVPTVVIHEPGLPDIVKVELSGNKEIRPVESVATGIWQEAEDTEPAGMDAVMEIELGQIRIRASNQANPMLLAEVIRQIGGIQGC